MSYFAISFALSFFVTLWLVRSHRLHARFSSDQNFDGPQKFHEVAVARIGGVGIMAGLLAFLLLSLLRTHPDVIEIGLLLLAASVAFLIGFLEDVTGRVSPLIRLVATALAAVLSGMWVDATITRLGFVVLDAWVQIHLVSLCFTAFAVAGIANAVNIIDGFNGLSSIVVCTMLLSLLYVGFMVGDVLVVSFSLALLGATFGFLLWNYPNGNIFLGDGGAYLLGFLVADFSVILVNRHDSVSPWYPVLLFVYPLVETFFSMYRRRLKRKPASVPDGVHLHSLIYRRMIRWVLGYQHLTVGQRNAMTSPYLWILSSMAVLPATLFFQHTWVLILFIVIFCVSYIWVYRRLVYFKSPFWFGWMHRHRKQPPQK
ncbi:MAG: MraY family glycosyltransferase [Formosimonas sp.]